MLAQQSNIPLSIAGANDAINFGIRNNMDFLVSAIKVLPLRAPRSDRDIPTQEAFEPRDRRPKHDRAEKVRLVRGLAFSRPGGNTSVCRGLRFLNS